MINLWNSLNYYQTHQKMFIFIIYADRAEVYQNILNKTLLSPVYSTQTKTAVSNRVMDSVTKWLVSKDSEKRSEIKGQVTNHGESFPHNAVTVTSRLRSHWAWRWKFVTKSNITFAVWELFQFVDRANLLQVRFWSERRWSGAEEPIFHSSERQSWWAASLRLQLSITNSYRPT